MTGNQFLSLLNWDLSELSPRIFTPKADILPTKMLDRETKGASTCSPVL